MAFNSLLSLKHAGFFPQKSKYPLHVDSVLEPKKQDLRSRFKRYNSLSSLNEQQGNVYALLKDATVTWADKYHALFGHVVDELNLSYNQRVGVWRALGGPNMNGVETSQAEESCHHCREESKRQQDSYIANSNALRVVSAGQVPSWSTREDWSNSFEDPMPESSQLSALPVSTSAEKVLSATQKVPSATPFRGSASAPNLLTTAVAQASQLVERQSTLSTTQAHATREPSKPPRSFKRTSLSLSKVGTAISRFFGGFWKQPMSTMDFTGSSCLTPIQNKSHRNQR